MGSSTAPLGERTSRCRWEPKSLSGPGVPRLLDTGQDGALHTWFAGFEGLRLALFPGLPRAYLARRTDGHDRAVRAAVARGAAHFESLAHDLLTRWREAGPPALAGNTACLAGPGAVCSD